jgi:hypothetical protein
LTIVLAVVQLQGSALKPEERLMQLNISGHHLDVTPSLKEYVVSKLDRLERHHDKITSSDVTLTVDKLVQKAEARCTYVEPICLLIPWLTICMQPLMVWQTSSTDNSSAIKKKQKPIVDPCFCTCSRHMVCRELC